MKIGLDIQIETHDRELLLRLFESRSFKRGMRRELPGEASIKLGNVVMCKAEGFPDILNLVIEFSTRVGASLAAGWLFSKLRKPTTIERLRIERREVNIDKGEILSAFEELVEYEKKRQE